MLRYHTPAKFCTVLILLLIANIIVPSQLNSQSNEDDFIPQPLPDDKQAELRSLLNGKWESPCLHLPIGETGQVINLISTWTFTAYGSVSTQPTEYADAGCTQRSKVPDSITGQFLAMKEIDKNHFYVDCVMQVSQVGKFRQTMMIKAGNAQLTMALTQDMVAVDFRPNTLQLVKK